MENNSVNLMELIPQLISITQAVDKMKVEQERIKKLVLEGMRNGNINKIDTEDALITYVAPVQRESFDSTKFKKECPEIYGKYIKESNAADSLRIKIKQCEEDANAAV